MQQAVEKAYNYASGWLNQGAVANYIPELSKANPNHFGICITNLGGNVYGIGNFQENFTIQSICKVILLATALQDTGFDEVFSRVGMEPTGDKFNSIVRLETGSSNKPLNPLINAGAIAVTSCIRGHNAQERLDKVLNLAQALLGNPDVTYSQEVFRSEKLTGDRNRALAYMMRSSAVFTDNAEEILDVYFTACSLLANCVDISHMGAVLANKGISPHTGQMIIDPYSVKVIRALMTVCGMYDASGEFALRVGVPAKSGVGGGILSVAPHRMGIATFAPRLDAKGNSYCGIKAMEFLSQSLSLSIF